MPPVFSIAELIEQTQIKYNEGRAKIPNDIDYYNDSEEVQTRKEQIFTESIKIFSLETETTLLQNIRAELRQNSFGQLKNIDTYRMKNGSGVLASVMHLNWPSIAKFLIEQGVNTNLKTNDGSTPLMLAAGGSYMEEPLVNFELVECLLKHGANPKSAKQTGTTALHYAAAGKTEEHLKIVTLLLEYQANPNAQITKYRGGTNPAYSGTPLHWAVMKGSLDIVKLLIKYGADINLPMESGRKGITPLEHAKIYKNPDIVEYLENQLEQASQTPRP